MLGRIRVGTRSRGGVERRGASSLVEPPHACMEGGFRVGRSGAAPAQTVGSPRCGRCAGWPVLRTDLEVIGSTGRRRKRPRRGRDRSGRQAAASRPRWSSASKPKPPRRPACLAAVYTGGRGARLSWIPRAIRIAQMGQPPWTLRRRDIGGACQSRPQYAHRHHRRRSDPGLIV